MNSFPDSKVASDDGGDWVMVPDESAETTSAQSSEVFKEESTNVVQAKQPSETIRKEDTIAGILTYGLDLII